MKPYMLPLHNFFFQNFRDKNQHAHIHEMFPKAVFLLSHFLQNFRDKKQGAHYICDFPQNCNETILRDFF